MQDRQPVQQGVRQLRRAGVRPRPAPRRAPIRSAISTRRSRPAAAGAHQLQGRQHLAVVHADDRLDVQQRAQQPSGRTQPAAAPHVVQGVQQGQQRESAALSPEPAPPSHPGPDRVGGAGGDDGQQAGADAHLLAIHQTDRDLGHLLGSQPSRVEQAAQSEGRCTETIPATSPPRGAAPRRHVAVGLGKDARGGRRGGGQDRAEHQPPVELVSAQVDPVQEALATRTGRWQG